MAGWNWPLGQGAGRERWTSNKKSPPGLLQVGLSSGGAQSGMKLGGRMGEVEVQFKSYFGGNPRNAGSLSSQTSFEVAGGSFFAAREAIPTRTQFLRHVLVGAENAID